MDEKTVMLRHTVATLAYRGGKALRGAPASFADYRATEGSRTPAEILAHIGDLLDWALSLHEGRQAWRDSAPLAWGQETARFFATAMPGRCTGQRAAMRAASSSMPPSASGRARTNWPATPGISRLARDPSGAKRTNTHGRSSRVDSR